MAGVTGQTDSPAFSRTLEKSDRYPCRQISISSPTAEDVTRMGEIALDVFFKEMAPIFGNKKTASYLYWRISQINRLYHQTLLKFHHDSTEVKGPVSKSTKCLVARDLSGCGRVLGFAFWILDDSPREETLTNEDKNLLPPTTEEPEGSDMELYVAFKEKMASVQECQMADRKRCYLQYLCIDPSIQRTGAGTALLKHVRKDAGDRPIYLEAAPTASAQPFYRKLGFEDLGMFEAKVQKRGQSQPCGVKLFAMKLESQTKSVLDTP